MTPLDEVPEPPTLAGRCCSCGGWTSAGRIVSDEGGASGGGETVVRCPGCCVRPYVRRPRASDPRRYPL